MGTRRNHGTNHDERQGPLKGGEGEESWAQGATTAQAMMNATGLFRKEGMCRKEVCHGRRGTPSRSELIRTFVHT